MSIYILLIIIVIFILFFGLALYDDFRRSDYEKAIDKAIKDMEKGITTTIIEDHCGNFTVKKYKDGKKL